MNKKYSYIGVSFVVLLFGIYVVRNIDRRLNDNDFVQDDRLNKVDKKSGSTNSLFKFNKVPDFEFTNQEGNIITNKTYEGKVFVVEFFFSTCPTICPKMNQSMLKLQDAFYGNPKFGLASITIDPEHDTSEVLKEHANLLGVKHYNWHFLTGNKEYIFSLANKGFNLYAGENNKAAGGFEHSGNFALIDKQGYIRSRTDAFGNPKIYYKGRKRESARGYSIYQFCGLPLSTQQLIFYC